jgi:hypothetical protein
LSLVQLQPPDIERITMKGRMPYSVTPGPDPEDDDRPPNCPPGSKRLDTKAYNGLRIYANGAEGYKYGKVDDKKPKKEKEKRKDKGKKNSTSRRQNETTL